MRITVVNQRRTNTGVYIGRPSPLGNPFTHRAGTKARTVVATREEAVARYEEWLYEHIRNRTPAIMKELSRLYGILKQHGSLELRCWCAPLKCHGDVVKRVLEYKLSQDQNQPQQ